MKRDPQPASSAAHCHGNGDPGRVKALHLVSPQHVAECIRGLEPEDRSYNRRAEPKGRSKQLRGKSGTTEEPICDLVFV